MKKNVFIPVIMLLSVIISCKSAPPNTTPETSITPSTAAPETPAITTPTTPTTPAPPSITTPATPTTPPITTPEIPATPTTPAITTPATPAIPLSTEILTVSKDRADAAKKRGIDFMCPSFFPSDWNAAEAEYAAAGKITLAVQDDVQRASAMYNSAADDYDEILRKTIPFYAKASENEIAAAREKLIKSGYADYFSEYLHNADEKALLASSQFENGDYINARDTGIDALSEYKAMNTGVEILSLRQEIIDLDFAKYDPDNFYKANETAQTAYDLYKAGNRETAVTDAKKALDIYNNVLAKGWTAYAGEMRGFASSEREQALTERTNVASRDLFNAADSVYAKAENSYKSRNYKDAAVSFADSQARFRLARNDTEEKRQRAFNAIKLAEEKIEESNEAVIDAERIIEGGTR